MAEVVLSLRDGRVVSYDRDAASFTVWEATPRSFAIDGGPLGIDAAVLATVSPLIAGPNDVIYATVDAATGDPVARLVAISTDPANAGAVVAEADELVDASGDTDLVATPLGVGWVSCCAFDVRRPAADGPIVMPWVDASGAATTDAGPSMWVEFRDDDSMDVVRVDGAVEQRWNVADVPSFRGMPLVVPLSDGGMVVDVTDFGETTTRLVRGFPDGTTTIPSTGEARVTAVRPDGSIIAFANGWVLLPPILP